MDVLPTYRFYKFNFRLIQKTLGVVALYHMRPSLLFTDHFTASKMRFEYSLVIRLGDSELSARFV